MRFEFATATQIMFGRAAGIAFGYSMDLEYSTVIPICAITETIQVLILYPLLKMIKKYFSKLPFQAVNTQNDTA